MHTVVVRVWLPDRPGALGQVASRIGAVRGDVLGIDILEVGGGRVIDELVVSLPDPELVDLMITEVDAVDGVAIEHVRPTDGEHTDGGVLALALAADLAESDPEDRLTMLVEGVARLTESAWTLVARGEAVVRSAGDAPPADWVTALLEGTRHLGAAAATSGDLFWATLPAADLWVAAGRPDRPVHQRERVRLELFTRIADALLS